MTKPRVGWFLPTCNYDFNTTPASVWIRCLQLIPYLAQLGITSVINQPDSEFNIAYFVRWQDEPALETARNQRKMGRKVIFDQVVNYLDPSGVVNGRFPVTPELASQSLRMVEVADQLTCASANIANRMRKVHPHVAYIPDSVDQCHFRHKKSVESFRTSRLRAIWSGNSSKAGELEPIWGLLEDLGYEIHLITDKPIEVRKRAYFGTRRCRYVFHHWRYETFPEVILNGDVCISYRELETPYNRGHSNFKIAVFMAQGIPAVVSPQPSYLEVVHEGTSGHVCRSLDDWHHVLHEMVVDADRCPNLSLGAIQAVEPFSTNNVVRILGDLLHCVLTETVDQYEPFRP